MMVVNMCSIQFGEYMSLRQMVGPEHPGNRSSAIHQERLDLSISVSNLLLLTLQRTHRIPTRNRTQGSLKDENAGRRVECRCSLVFFG
jgi:hypothetical protein